MDIDFSKMKYSRRDFKGDLIAGSLNGVMFSGVYSYFYWPIDRLDTHLSDRLRRSPWLYAGVSALKLGVAFAIMRSTYNCVRKEELDEKHQLLACMGAFGLVCTFI